MLPLEDDKEVKLEPEETVSERAKLNSQRRKNAETGLKILTGNKLLLTRFPILLAHTKNIKIDKINLLKLRKKKVQ